MGKIEPHGIEPPEPPIGWAVVLLAIGFVILMLATFFTMTDEERHPPARVVDVETIKTIDYEGESNPDISDGGR